jgi:hypothetical protein
MSVNVTLNGVVYPVPTQGDLNWAPLLTRYLVALGTYALTPIGGTFTLTGNVDFGSTYGLIVKYITSKTTTPATAGVIRLAKTDTIEWRDNAGTGENVLSVDSLDLLTYNGVQVSMGLATLADGKIWIGSAGNLPVAQTLTGDVTVDNTGLTAITALSIVNADVSNSAAIAYSKLNLSGSIVNNDIGSSAAIAFSKLAGLTANRVLLTDGSGVISASSVSNTTLGYLDATSSIQTQLNGKATNPLSGNLAAGGYKITGLAAGTINGDSVRYEQVVGTYLPVSGGTLTGDLTVGQGGTGLLNAIVNIDGSSASSYGSQLRFKRNSVQKATIGTYGSIFGGASDILTLAGVSGNEGVLIQGTATNNNAPVGFVGEYVKAYASYVSMPVSVQWGDAISISLTAGDWDVSAHGVINAAAQGGVTVYGIGISIHPGNDATDLTEGATYVLGWGAQGSLAIPQYHFSLSTTTTVYLKMIAAYSSTAPTMTGTISARRMR